MDSELDQALTKQTSKIKDVRKTRYHNIRAMGFGSTEAMILSGWNEERVLKLAKERGYIQTT